MKKYIAILFLIVGTLSCDVLDLAPLDKISEVDTWADQSLIQLYTNGSYNVIIHSYTDRMIMAACDEGYNSKNNAEYFLVQQGELTADNVTQMDKQLNYWKFAYGYIRSINIFFSKIDDAPVDADFKKGVKGEMKFIRAYAYANLIWRYGGVPIITKVFGLNEEYNSTRDSYDACVDFIVKELDEAIPMLPSKQPASEKGRASAHACMALKARVLLHAASPQNNPDNSTAKWQKAADAAEGLLNVGYALQDDYQSVFLEDNNEIIFARYFTSSSSVNFNALSGRNGSNGNNLLVPTQNHVNAYEMAATGLLPYTEQPDGTLVVNTASGYDPNNPYIGRDPRFEASILHDGSMWAGRETESWHGGLDSPENPTTGWDASLTSYSFKKFMMENVPPRGASVDQTNPWIYFRYAEVLLNYAEAKFKLGDEPTAREYLNKVRSRKSVMMPDVTDTDDKLWLRIQNERRVELAFEDHRFFDVRRWKIAMETENKDLLSMNINKLPNGTKTYEIISLKERDFLQQHYLIPIPRAEINKSLGSLDQNPDY